MQDSQGGTGSHLIHQRQWGRIAVNFILAGVFLVVLAIIGTSDGKSNHASFLMEDQAQSFVPSALIRASLLSGQLFPSSVPGHAQMLATVPGSFEGNVVQASAPQQNQAMMQASLSQSAQGMQPMGTQAAATQQLQSVQGYSLPAMSAVAVPIPQQQPSVMPMAAQSAAGSQNFVEVVGKSELSAGNPAGQQNQLPTVVGQAMSPAPQAMQAVAQPVLAMPAPGQSSPQNNVQPQVAFQNSQQGTAAAASASASASTPYMAGAGGGQMAASMAVAYPIPAQTQSTLLSPVPNTVAPAAGGVSYGSMPAPMQAGTQAPIAAAMSTYAQPQPTQATQQNYLQPSQPAPAAQFAQYPQTQTAYGQPPVVQQQLQQPPTYPPSSQPMQQQPVQQAQMMPPQPAQAPPMMQGPGATVPQQPAQMAQPRAGGGAYAGPPPDLGHRDDPAAFTQAEHLAAVPVRIIISYTCLRGNVV
jgi:hypothetical protein